MTLADFTLIDPNLQCMFIERCNESETALSFYSLKSTDKLNVAAFVIHCPAHLRAQLTSPRPGSE